MPHFRQTSLQIKSLAMFADVPKYLEHHLSSRLSLFRHIAATDSVQQSLQTGSVPHLLLKFPYSIRQKRKPGC